MSNIFDQKYCHICNELMSIHNNFELYCSHCSPDKLTTDTTICQICFNKMLINCTNNQLQCFNKKCL